MRRKESRTEVTVVLLVANAIFLLLAALIADWREPAFWLFLGFGIGPALGAFLVYRRPTRP